MDNRTVDYVTVDVFTQTRFGGNPLAVIPDARGLSDQLMQRIATEFNFSEVTFVLPPRDPANTARVRIFAPAYEVPFAGHPNVGTAYALARRGEVFGQAVMDVMRFEESSGLVEAKVVRAGGVVGAEVKAPRLLELGDKISPEMVAACASLPASEVVTSRHQPLRVSVGLPFVVAEIANVEALAQATPNTVIFAEADARYPHRDDGFALFLYVRVADQPEQLQARMFAPLSNTFEDPATGSASAALGAYLYALRPEANLTGGIEIVQGVEMGRRSVINLRVEKVSGAVQRVIIRGHCVEMMKGIIQL